MLLKAKTVENAGQVSNKPVKKLSILSVCTKMTEHPKRAAKRRGGILRPVKQICCCPELESAGEDVRSQRLGKRLKLGILPNGERRL